MSLRTAVRRFTAPLACVGALGLAGCGALGETGNRMSESMSNLGGLVTPYKVEIIQGNFLSKEQVAALRKGMSRDEVRNVLGTPLVTSAFHADRWDYAFSLNRQGVAKQERRYAVRFKNEVLDTFEGDAMPSEIEFVATLVPGRQFNKAPLLQASEDKLLAFTAKSAVAAPAAVVANTLPLRVDYPPLEAAKRP